MRRVRAKLLAALALGALTLAARGRRAARPPGRRAARERGPSVSGALQGLQRSGAITPAQYAQYSGAYVAAKRSLGRLSGTRAHRARRGAGQRRRRWPRRGHFIASRLPVCSSRSNATASGGRPNRCCRSGARVSFPGSKIVWEYYAGQGIEIQWLGTFGEANGYYLSGHENANLRQLLDEVLPLATKRAGGIAWEYMFQFDGGRAAVDERALAGHRAAGARALVVALQGTRAADRRAAGARHLPDAAPERRAGEDAGRRRTTPSTPTRPSDRILNGFIQAVVGLYDYTQITKDPLGLKLFEAGDAEARARRRATTPAPGRCTTSSPNRTSTTTNC